MSEYYRELRCTGCHKLICLEYIFEGRLKYVCPRCDEVNTFNFKHRKTQHDKIKKVEDNIN